MPQPAPPQVEPLLLRGSLIVLRRQCGKRACHCAEGGAHETPALSVSVAGVTRILTLRRQDLPEVRAALRRYQQALADLDRKALVG
ncbi:MAG: DUF6788 family protein, partial [candidate division NC10 bacterium]